MKPKFRFITFLIATSLLLSACTIQINTTINPDGAGEWRIEFGLNAEDREMLLEYEMTPEEFCEDPNMREDMPPGADFFLEERGDETWCVFVIPFSSLDELAQTYSEGDGITVNRLEIIEDQFYYDLEVDLSEDDAGMPEDFEFDLVWQVTAPGKIGANNADRVEGNTLTWNLTPGQVVNLQAESLTSSGGLMGGMPILGVVLTLACLCGVGVVVIGAGGAIFFVIRRRNEEEVEA